MTKEYEMKLLDQRTKVVAFIKKCVAESRQNEKLPRRPQNRMNWDYVNGTVDWSHKRADELPYCVHLHKIGIAAERIRAKFKGALVNYDKWISVEREYDQAESLMPDYAARSLLLKQLVDTVDLLLEELVFQEQRVDPTLQSVEFLFHCCQEVEA